MSIYIVFLLSSGGHQLPGPHGDPGGWHGSHPASCVYDFQHHSNRRGVGKAQPQVRPHVQQTGLRALVSGYLDTVLSIAGNRHFNYARCDKLKSMRTDKQIQCYLIIASNADYNIIMHYDLQ